MIIPVKNRLPGLGFRDPGHRHDAHSCVIRVDARVCAFPQQAGLLASPNRIHGAWSRSHFHFHRNQNPPVHATASTMAATS